MGNQKFRLFLERVSFDDLTVQQKKQVIKYFPGCFNWHKQLVMSLQCPRNKAEL